MVLAPDGKSIVVTALADDGTIRLYLRRLDGPDWKPLPGTEGAYFPFWSPDGRSVGFFAANKLKKITVDGGTADTICDAATARGGTWNQEGVIVFAPGSDGPLVQVKAEGGPVTPATELDASRGEVGHRFPRFLPDGRHFLYGTIPAKDGGHESWLATLGSKERTFVLSSEGVPTFAPPDRLVYLRNERLYIQAFDPAAGKLSGESHALVAAGRAVGFMASPSSTAAGTGVLAYVPPSDDSTNLVWFGLDGVQGETVSLPAGLYTDLRLSPDGTRVATSRFERDNPTANGSDIWLVDLARKSGSRVTFDPQFEFAPVWSPDGSALYFNSNTTGGYLIYRKSSEGAGEPVAISKPMGLTEQPHDITRDGKFIVFETTGAKTGSDLQILDTGGTKPPVPYLSTPVNESQARLAPDGHWIAYVSDETGRTELYVQTFPAAGSKLQVSNDGARSPVWSRDGKRLFFIAPDESLMAVEVAQGAGLRVSAPVKLFRFPRTVSAYDVAPDGKRLMATMSASDAGGRSIGLILDWVAAGK